MLFRSSSPQRLPGLPDLPTAAEMGFPGVSMSAWHGLFAPAGTPEPVQEAIAAALRHPGRTVAAIAGDGDFLMNGQELATAVQHGCDILVLVIDNGARSVTLAGQPVDFTSAEYDLLWLLAANAGRILSREEIFNSLRGIEYDGQDRSIDVRISRIRPKIGDDPMHPRLIKTVRGKGYLFVSEAAAALV